MKEILVTMADKASSNTKTILLLMVIDWQYNNRCIEKQLKLRWNKYKTKWIMVDNSSFHKLLNTM